MTPFTFSPAYILPTGIAQVLWKNDDIWRNLPWNITLCYYSLLDNYLSENSVTDLWFWEEHTCCSTLLRFTLFNLFWELEQNAIERCMGWCVVERISGWCVFVTSASIILGPIRDAAFPKMDEFAENFQTASEKIKNLTRLRLAKFFIFFPNYPPPDHNLGQILNSDLASSYFPLK